MADAIILAGGFGTRLKEVVPELPKPLAPIQGVAFLDLLLDTLERSEVIDHVILAVGYRADAIVSRYRDAKRKVPILFSEEKQPLGTGGAVKLALHLARSSPVFVLNGDSYLHCSLRQMLKSYRAPVTIAATRVENATRYGQIEMDALNQISVFMEKAAADQPGWINGGIYLMEKTIFEKQPDVFSLEKDLLPALLDQGIFGFPVTGLFIDIGTPASWMQAQDLLKSFIEE